MDAANHYNLEYFPEEILLKIFARTDDNSLLNLADSSHRFAAIAQTVFEKKYRNRYFKLYGGYRGGDPELYLALFNRFGSSVKAIHMTQFGGNDDAAWATEILNQHSNHVEKLAFYNCSLPFMLKSWSTSFPKCPNLKKLEIQSSELYKNNEHDKNTITTIADNLHYLKDLAFVYKYVNLKTPLPDEIDRVVHSFQHFESLTLSLVGNMFEFLRRIGTDCKSIKHLALYTDTYMDIEFLEAVCSFEQIVSLYLGYRTIAQNRLGSLVEHLPNLCHLRVHGTSYEFKELLVLFRRGSSLEKITIADSSEMNTEKFINARLFEKFIDTVIPEKPNARIECEEGGKIFGSIAERGIVWRKKLMHWIGFDKNCSLSNIHLMDLANQPVESNVKPQKNLLDLIFDCLDVYSLCSIGKINTHCERLVESYVERHSQQNGTFTITDEFFCLDLLPSEFHLNSIFNRYIINLHFDKVLDHPNVGYMIDDFERLKKLSIQCENLLGIRFFGRNILSEVRHFIIDSSLKYYSILHETFILFPNIEIIEIKRESFRGINDFETLNPIPNKIKLKKCIFKYCGKTQLKILKTLFKNCDTQLIPIY